MNDNRQIAINSLLNLTNNYKKLSDGTYIGKELYNDLKKLVQLELKKKYKLNNYKLEKQNALNGSRRKSVKKKPPVASKNVDRCKGMTIPEIRQFLLSMGVDKDAIPPKMLKKDLCELYKSLTE